MARGKGEKKKILEGNKKVARGNESGNDDSNVGKEKLKKCPRLGKEEKSEESIR